MAHAQKPDFVFRRNGRVHLKRQGRQFSLLPAAELCASAVVTLDTPSSELVKGTGYPLRSPVSPSLPPPCVAVCHYISTGLYSSRSVNIKETNKYNLRKKCVFLTNNFMLLLHRQSHYQTVKKCQVSVCNKYIEKLGAY